MLLNNPFRFGSFTPLSIPTCVAWWDSQDGSTFTLSGSELQSWVDKKNSLDLVIDTNGPEEVNFVEGKMFRFDRSNSERIKVTSALLNPGSGDASYVIVYRGTDSTKGILFGRTGTGSHNYQMSINDAAVGSLRAELSDATPTATGVEDTTFIGYNDDQVRFALLTFDAAANVVRLYADDFDDASEVDSDLSYNPGDIEPTNPFYVGTWDGASDFFEGSIGEVMMFSSVLTSDERSDLEGWIRTHWELTSFSVDPGIPAVGTVTARYSSWDAADYTLDTGEVTQLNDLSVNSNHMVNGHSVSIGPGIVALDGTNWLDFTGAELLGVTAAAADPGALDQSMVVVFKADGANVMAMTGKLGAGNPHYFMRVNTTASNLRFQLRDSGSTPIILVSPPGEDFSDSTKRIAAYTYDDSLADGFLYGRSPMEEVDSDLVYNSATISPSEDLFIGSLIDSGIQLWDGQIAEVIYFSNPLTKAELGALYHYLKRKWGFYNK